MEREREEDAHLPATADAPQHAVHPQEAEPRSEVGGGGASVAPPPTVNEEQLTPDQLCGTNVHRARSLTFAERRRRRRKADIWGLR